MTEYKWVVLIVTTVGAFMAALDSSVLIVGLPTVLHELNATLVHGVWVMTGYRLATTILLVAIGRVADMLSARATFWSGQANASAIQPGKRHTHERFATARKRGEASCATRSSVHGFGFLSPT